MAEYKVNGQINLGWNQSFAATKAVPMIAKRVWDTLENATLFAKEDATAVVGLILTVNNDSTNNGVYRIAAIGANAVLEKVGDVDLSNYYNKEEVVGLIPDVPVKGIKLNDVEQLPDENGIVSLEFEIPAPEDVDLSGYYTKEEVDNAFATKEEIPSLDGYLTSSDAEATYVKQEGYIAYTQEEKNKLAGIAEGAEVNYVKSVGDNLSVDGEGKLTVNIPTVDVPFQSVSELDKILTLENGVLSSTVTFAKEEIEGQEYLVVRGKNNEELGKVSTAEFTADSFLDDVTIEDGNINFTWKMADGTEKTDSVDLSNYIKPYNADGETIELNAETNTFSVKDGVFAKSADLATVATSGSYNDLSDKPEIPSIEGLATTTDVENAVEDMATQTWVGGELENYAKTADLVDSYSKEESDAKYALAGSGELNTIEKIQVKEDSTTTKVLEVGDGKTVTIDLSGLDSRLDTLEGLVVGGEGEGLAAILGDVEKLKTEKQDKLSEGSAEKPHLIWVSETNEEGVTTGAWTPGKIEIPVTPEVRLVPETTGVESPAILAWDGANIVWSSSEVQKELPDYSIDNAGQILTVNTEGNIVWQAAPVSTTVTKDVIAEGQTQTYTITQDENSVTVYDAKDVYTKTEVDNMFTWQTV